MKLTTKGTITMKTNSFKSASILIPKKDHEKWSVVACDQFTSNLEYWQESARLAKGAPSALDLILPEIYLKEDNSESVCRINTAMKNYLDSGVFNEFTNAMIYVERTQNDKRIRRGIVGAVDLEKYDYRKGSKTLIRATEETVPDRLPPRVKIREGACLELPHVMLLIDDPENKVIGNLQAKKESFERVYSFDLMMKGGHLDGYLIDGENCDLTATLLDSLAVGEDPLLFAVGDGNHSLAAAKECYLKNPTPENRYALVEIVNIYDDALVFEPIYRVLFGIGHDKLITEMNEFFGNSDTQDAHSFEVLCENGRETITLPAISSLPVGTIQLFINALCTKYPEIRVDYVHEAETVEKLSREADTVGFIFEGMKKSELFTAVKKDGALPRKTFSMGMGQDKRYYMEARKIK